MSNPQLDLDQDPYSFFMENEPHLNKTEPVIDPETGWRYTYRDIGMTRNATEDNVKEMKVYLDPIPHVILDQNVPLRGWYKSKHEPANVRARPCDTDAILTQPYGGFCPVGCGFCYINNGVRGYRGQGITTVDPRYPEKVRDQLSKMNIGQAVYMSSFIDPFVELEDHYHNTEGTARAAVDAGLPIFFLTRREIPGWAYDLLEKNKYSYLQMSINTPDPDDWRRLSPRALPLYEMLDQVSTAHRRGIYVSIQVNPIVYGITSEDQICELIDILAMHGADHLIFKFVEIVYPSVKAIVRQMEKRFNPERAQLFADAFTQNIGGVRTIAEEIRVPALERFSDQCEKAGVTMSLCYEYVYERDANGAILSKRGRSIGADFRTSDQCHGHRVPVHVRKGDKFVPLDECPPAGCLTCKEVAGAPCGSDFLASAPAWTPVDLKRTIK